MAKVSNGFRKIVVGLIGFPMLVVGIILIPLPGPGVLVSMLAFFILSLEFNWAEKYLNDAVKILKEIWRKSQERADRFEQKYTNKNDKDKK